MKKLLKALLVGLVSLSFSYPVLAQAGDHDKRDKGGEHRDHKDRDHGKSDKGGKKDRHDKHDRKW